LTLRHDDDFDAVFHFNETKHLEIINAIWKFRNKLTPVCFTLDAGANVHVLYPENDSEKVLQFRTN
jgi:mevalonate pyrophosphate decarboxylase